ncbi:MAG: hypothetical protein ACIALR_07145, partial [Blastopirellula sp. JB062]
EPVLLQATEEATELQNWRLNDGEILSCEPLPMESDDAAEFATYELRLPPGTQLPATLTTELSRSATQQATPILVSAPLIAAQTNRLDVAAPGAWQLTVGDAFPLSPIYEESLIGDDELQVRRFRYLAIDVSRDAESAGRPSLRIERRPVDMAPYAESADLRYELRRDAILADAQYRFIAASDGKLRFQLPPNCSLLAIQVNDRPVAATVVSDHIYEVSVNGGAQTQECSLRYETPPPRFSLLRPFHLQRPQENFDVLQTEVSVSSEQLVFFVWEKSLSSHLRQMFLHGLCQPQHTQPQDHAETIADNESTIRAVDPKQIASLGYACLGVSFLIGWLVPGRRIRLLAVALAIALATVVLPTTLAPLTAGILQGLVAGAIVRWFVNSWSVSESIESSGIGSAVGAILMLTTLLPGSPAYGQSPAAAKEKPTVYTIWIPVDEEKQPTGDVYLPQTLYDYLFSAAENPIYVAKPVDVTAVSWRISPPGANLPETFGVAGVFDATSAINGASLEFPLSADFLAGIQSVTVDEIPLSMDDIVEKETLSITLDDAGEHRIKIVAQLPSDKRIDWQTPLCLNAELRYESIASRPVARILADGEPLSFESLSTFTSVPLGPVSQISWAPTADSQDGRFHAEQIELLEIGQAKPQLISRIQLAPINGEVKVCRLRLDPRLQWKEVSLPGVSIESAPGELTATFEPAITEPTALEFAFALSDSNGMGAFDIPRVTVVDAETTERWAAISAPMDVETTWRKEASGLTSVMTPSFVEAWPAPIEGLRRAFDLSNNQSTPAIVDVRPVETQSELSINQNVHIGTRRSDYRLDLQLNAVSGEIASLSLELPPGWQVGNVACLADGVMRDVVSQYDEATSRLSLFFPTPLRTMAELQIRGHFATDMATALRLKTPRVFETQVETSYLNISHDPDVRIRRLPNNDAEAFEAAPNETPQPLNSRDGESYGSFRVLDPNGEMELVVLPNNVEIGGEMLLSALGDDAGWKVRIDCRLRLKRIAPDQLEFLAPANYKL